MIHFNLNNPNEPHGFVFQLAIVSYSKHESSLNLQVLARRQPVMYTHGMGVRAALTFIFTP